MILDVLRKWFVASTFVVDGAFVTEGWCSSGELYVTIKSPDVVGAFRFQTTFWMPGGHLTFKHQSIFVGTLFNLLVNMIL